MGDILEEIGSEMRGQSSLLWIQVGLYDMTDALFIPFE